MTTHAVLFTSLPIPSSGHVGWLSVIAVWLLLLYAIYEVLALRRVYNRGQPFNYLRRTAVLAVVFAVAYILYVIDGYRQRGHLRPLDLILIAGWFLVVIGSYFYYRGLSRQLESRDRDRRDTTNRT